MRILPAVALAATAASASLEVVFVEMDGRRERQLVDMPVRIVDAKGRVVFDGKSEGPAFLARLPRGHYMVSTRWDAWSFLRHVSIGRERKRVVFKWSKPAEPTAPAQTGA
jgi:hypothetical protein